MAVTIWHNPKCSTSRKALDYLREHGVEPTVYLYLTENPSRSKIEKTLKLAGLKPSQGLRRVEPLAEELGLKDGASEKAILDAMVENPILIQRPVVITDKGAVFARPVDKFPEQIDPLL
jgi:arsenate reductase